MHLARFTLPATLLTCLLLATPVLAAPLPVLSATYSVPTPPTTLVQGASAAVSITVQNVGNEIWNTTGTNPVKLSYHWYDAAGNAVMWDGPRTPLLADVATGASHTLTAAVASPPTPGAYRLTFALVKEGVAWFPQSAPFTVQIASATTSATYAVATPPTTIAAGGNGQIAVALTNTGNQTWNIAGANPVNLSLHWYDAAGNTVLWDGPRTALGAPVEPNASRTITATVTAPPVPGAYLLRFALVKEGVAWFPASNPLPITAQAGFVAAVTPPTLPSFIAGGSYDVPVVLKNTGALAWNATGPNLVDVSYHWSDSAGNAVIWDGVRTPLAADVAPGASANVTLKVGTPQAPGTYTLTIDLVREGIGWFGTLAGGSAPYRVPATVGALRYAATFGAVSPMSAYWAEAKTIAVTLTNTGNIPWSGAGANPVNLSYHILDAAGRAVVWDGIRTPLGGDVLPGQAKSLNIAFITPGQSGSYTLVVDLVREGIGWFEGTGSPPARVPLSVSSGFSAGYAATTTPGQVTIGATIALSTTVLNYGPRAWSAGNVSLSYHITTAGGDTVVWDGARGKLPNDVPPFSQVTVPITVAMPRGVGSYVISWDMVLEGVAWFSSTGVAMKSEPFTVVSGVVFYGSGFGHGLGMSQYGANGWATGATGLTLNAEQIVQKYYPGTTFQFVDASRPQVRVLLSQPSSTTRYRCGDNRFFAGSYGDVTSDGGFRVLDELSGNAEVGRAGPKQQWQFVAKPGGVEVWDNGGASPRLVRLVASVAVVPLDPNQPLGFVQKGVYRGNFRFTSLGGTLRVINVATWDDYLRGVIPLEMPTSWHPEALKAQAYAARSYAYNSYKGGIADYDVSDDQSDQCYGGSRVEVASSNAAVQATLGKLITFNNAAIRAYFASANGGYTLPYGCFGNRVVRSGASWACTPDPNQPFLGAVPDPADRAVTSPANPRASWTVTLTGSQIRDAVLRCNGTDIGALQAVDLSNRSVPVVGHVISVRIIGSYNSVDLQAEQFLRTCLGLRSTMVRLSPF